MVPASRVLISTLTMTLACKELEPLSAQFNVVQLTAMLTGFKKLWIKYSLLWNKNRNMKEKGINIKFLFFQQKTNLLVISGWISIVLSPQLSFSFHLMKF